MNVVVDRVKHQIGETEAFYERVPVALVRFDGHDQLHHVRLSELVKDRQIELYDSLESGDLVVYGSQKMACGLVLENVRKRQMRTNVAATDRRVMVFENGSKKLLPLGQEIIRIQRARDFI